MCPERSATSAYHRVCHAGKAVRLDFMADTTTLFQLKSSHVQRTVIIIIRKKQCYPFFY